MAFSLLLHYSLLSFLNPSQLLERVKNVSVHVCFYTHMRLCVMALSRLLLSVCTQTQLVRVCTYICAYVREKK